MMKVILNALQAASVGAQQPSSAAQTTGTGKVSPAIATTVHITIERVFDHCQQVCACPNDCCAHGCLKSICQQAH